MQADIILLKQFCVGMALCEEFLKKTSLGRAAKLLDELNKGDVDFVLLSAKKALEEHDQLIAEVGMPHEIWNEQTIERIRYLTSQNSLWNL